MITNLMLTGRYTIDINKNGSFKVGEHKLNIKKIPFVRYRLDSYDEREIEYIKQMKKQFCYSVHLVEFTLGNNTADEVVHVRKGVGRLPRFLLIPVTDDKLGGLTEEDLQNLQKCAEAELEFNRVLLLDKSTSMTLVEANRLIAQVSSVLFVEGGIGICGSPLSIYPETSCLSAVKARELAMDYYDGFGEWPLPTANHQVMEGCSCIRHLIIDHHIRNDKGDGLSVNSKKNSESTSKQQGSKVILSFSAFLKNKGYSDSGHGANS